MERDDRVYQSPRPGTAPRYLSQVRDPAAVMLLIIRPARCDIVNPRDHDKCSCEG